VAVGTNALDVALNTAKSWHTHVLVFTKSSLGEQTTPASLTIVDTSASASSVAFSELDLDSGELGGVVTWSAPADTSLVANYVVYLAQDAAGTNRTQLGTLAVGTHSLDVALDTAEAAYTHVLVFTASSLGEQTTPASVVIVGVSSSFDVQVTLVFTVGHEDFSEALAGELKKQ